MRPCWIKSLLSLLLFAGSLLALRWTHHAGWVAGLLAGFALLVLSVSDMVNQSVDSSRWRIPSAVHAMALIAFTIGVIAVLFVYGSPDYRLAELVAGPFILAGSVYLAFLVTLSGS